MSALFAALEYLKIADRCNKKFMGDEKNFDIMGRKVYVIAG